MSTVKQVLLGVSPANRVQSSNITFIFLPLYCIRLCTVVIGAAILANNIEPLLEEDYTLKLTATCPLQVVAQSATILPIMEEPSSSIATLTFSLM